MEHEIPSDIKHQSSPQNNMKDMILCTRFITLTIATVAGLTSYAAAAIVDTSPHPPSASDHFATTSNGKSKRSELLVLKGFSATNGVTKFLKPKRNMIRGERKTKEHDRKLQASPQLFDIVLGNFDKSGAINQLLVNNGAGGYDEADVEDLPGGDSRTSSIVVTDVDNDGFDDIILGNDNEANQLLINNGNNTFTVSNLPGGTLETSSIATADVNKDGDLDIILGNGFNVNQLLINNGDNTFTASDLPGGTLTTNSIATADVDNDGDIDIIVGNTNSQANQVFINNGNNTFTVSDLPDGDLVNTRSIVTADVDGDGLDDVIVGNIAAANQVLINNGDNTFTASDLPGGTLDTRSITAADVNKDGFDDIIVGNFNQPNQVLINDGNGTFTASASDLPGGTSPTFSIATADIDNDGFEDIIVGNDGQANQLLINDGNGMFTPSDLPGGTFSTRSITVISRAAPPGVSMFYSYDHTTFVGNIYFCCSSSFPLNTITIHNGPSQVKLPQYLEYLLCLQVNCHQLVENRAQSRVKLPRYLEYLLCLQVDCHQLVQTQAQSLVEPHWYWIYCSMSPIFLIHFLQPAMAGVCQLPVEMWKRRSKR